MADEDVGAGVDRRAREGAGEIGGLGQLALSLGRDQARMAIFMAVEVDHDPVGLPACFAYRAQVALDVGLVAFARHLEAVAAHEGLVEQRDHLVALGADLAVAEEMLALARALLREAKLAADALELLEGFAVHRIGVLEAERIDARPPAQIGTLRARAIPGPEGRGGGEDGNTPAPGVEIARHARLGEVGAAARMGDAGGIVMKVPCVMPGVPSSQRRTTDSRLAVAASQSRKILASAMNSGSSNTRKRRVSMQSPATAMLKWPA